MRAYTEEEVRDLFLEVVQSYVKEWSSDSPAMRSKTTEERISGAVFSLLVILDGESIDLPGFSVTPLPHPGDEEYHRKRGEKWFPFNIDIAGELHDLWARRK